MSVRTRDTQPNNTNNANQKTHASPPTQPTRLIPLSTLALSSSNSTKTSKSPAPAPDSTQQTESGGQSGSRVLAIPPELRDEIYSAALFGPSNLALLQTCRQVNMEAQAALYQRPVSHSSQAALFTWAENSRSSNLKRVTVLALRLTDVDLSRLFSHDFAKPHTHTSAWRLYQQELERLDQTFQKLTSITTLRIVPPAPSHSQLLMGMYLSLLALLPRRCPKLVHLTVDDNDLVLQRVPALKGIAHVTFTYSSAEQDSDSDQRTSTARKGAVKTKAFKTPIKKEPGTERR